jgi:DNA-binding NarL/FixJ family response regulator
MRLFLVDDSQVVRKRLLDLSNQVPGVDVVGTAATAAEAVAGLYLYRPDVLILDIHLGPRTGFDLLNLVGQELPETVVVLITSGATEPYRAAAAKLGVTYLFDKANDISQLQGALTELVAAKTRKLQSTIPAGSPTN